MLAIGDGRFRITGPIYTGETWAMGRSVALRHAAGTLVVSERPMEPLDLGVFTSLGVDPAAFDFLLLKSRMYCRPAFGPLGCGLVECDSGGVTGLRLRTVRVPPRAPSHLPVRFGIDGVAAAMLRNPRRRRS